MHAEQRTRINFACEGDLRACARALTLYLEHIHTRRGTDRPTVLRAARNGVQCVVWCSTPHMLCRVYAKHNIVHIAEYIVYGRQSEMYGESRDVRNSPKYIAIKTALLCEYVLCV